MAMLPMQHSQLFTVRIWREDLGDGRCEWRGQVKNLASGEAHYFRNWAVMVEKLQKMLPVEDGMSTTAPLDRGDS